MVRGICPENNKKRFIAETLWLWITSEWAFMYDLDHWQYVYFTLSATELTVHDAVRALASQAYQNWKDYERTYWD